MFILSSQVFADNKIALMYGGTNPDHKPLDTPYGFSLSGEFDLSNGLFVAGYFRETDFVPGGPDAAGATITGWTEISIGHAFTDEWGEFYSMISLESIKTDRKTIDGYGAHFGYRINFTDALSGVLQLGYIKTDFEDWQLVERLEYKLTDSLALTFSLRDYDKWDYTNYEAGIVLTF